MLLQMALFYSFYGWVIFQCISVPHLLSPFLCWWTFSLLRCLGCCEWCCCAHWGVHIFLNCGFLQIHAQDGIAGYYGNSNFSCLNNTVVHSGFTNLHSHQQYKDSLSSALSPAFVICRLFDDGHSDLCEVIAHYKLPHLNIL